MKGRKVFKCWGVLKEKYWEKLGSGQEDWCEGHLCLLIIVSLFPALLPRNQVTGFYLSWWLHFKVMAPRSLRKTFLACGRYVTKGQRKDLQSQVLKTNASKKMEVRSLQSCFRTNSKFFWQHGTFSKQEFEETGSIILGMRPWAELLEAVRVLFKSLSVKGGRIIFSGSLRFS